MKCSMCGAENRTGVRFCENCGAGVEVPIQVKAEPAGTCDACGAQTRTGIRFCENCGNSLTAPEAKSPQVGKVRCSNCGEDNSPIDRFCNQCGNSLIAVDLPKGIACESCGTVNRPDVRFCEHCGFDFRQPAPKVVHQKIYKREENLPAAQPGNSSGRSARAFLGAAAVISLLAGIFWIINNFNRFTGGTSYQSSSSSGNQSSLDDGLSNSGGQPNSQSSSAYLDIRGGANPGELMVSLDGFPANENIIIGIGLADAIEMAKAGDILTDGQGQGWLIFTPCNLVDPGSYEVRGVGAGVSASSFVTIDCSTNQASVPEEPAGQQNPPESAGQSNSPPQNSEIPNTLPDVPRVQLTPYVSVAPYRGGQGTTHNVFIRNFQPNETVHLTVYNEESRVILVEWDDQVDGQGSAVPMLTIGNNFALGNYIIAADGSQGSMARGRFILEDQCMGDVDCDGLPDEGEQWFADTFAPYYIFDEQEPAPLMDIAFVYQVTGRFTPDLCNGQTVMVVVALYVDDWIQTNEFLPSMRWHFGDTEAAYLCFDGYDLSKVSVIRHGVLFTYEVSQPAGKENDFNCSEVAKKKFICDAPISFYGTHPVFYASQGKHAVFMNKTECEEASFYEGIVTLKEDCGGGNEMYAYLPSNLNVGERSSPNFLYADEQLELAWLFPGELIWQDGEAFCGGYDVTPGLRNSKQKSPKDDVPVCAGALSGKWYP